MTTTANRSSDKRKLNVTRAVIFDAIAMHEDKNAYIEQNLLHTDMLGLTLPIPPTRTERLRWVDTDRPPIPDGSEYVVADTPPMPGNNATFMNSFLDVAYEEYKSGGSHAQVLQSKSNHRLDSLYIIVCVVLMAMAFAILPLVYPTPPPDTATETAAAEAAVSNDEVEGILKEQRDAERERLREEARNAEAATDTSTTAP